MQESSTAPGQWERVVWIAKTASWQLSLASFVLGLNFHYWHVNDGWVPYLTGVGLSGVAARLGDPVQRYWRRRFP
jgi:hypothetical protein